MVQAYRLILKEEGVLRGLYAGVTPAMLGSERFKTIAHENYKTPDGQLPMGIDLVTGSLAGGIAGAVTTPLDVMKTLLQTQHPSKKGSKPTTAPDMSTSTGVSSAPQPKHYSGIVEGLVWNYKNQGIGGLFRGIGPRVFWTSLQSAIMFVIYEQILHLEASLRERGEWPPNQAARHLFNT
ncbi:hypothetical protein DFQ29_001741 [Apophysomyces sp. BC1021]|nr:hypothetical protein DFQ29_001741 [Apophysomyces sp. BC1021]